MWKKDDVAQDGPAPRSEAPRGPERASRAQAPAERATIGRSITIRGEVTGDEDLLIQGRVEGSVDLGEHAVTVGPDGEVDASIAARIVTVEGSVKGDLTAEEQIVLRASARVQGDITAARIVLEDGARFRGGVDMGDVGTGRKRSAADAAGSSSTRPAPGPASTSGPSQKPSDDRVSGSSPGQQSKSDAEKDAAGKDATGKDATGKAAKAGR